MMNLRLHESMPDDHDHHVHDLVPVRGLCRRGFACLSKQPTRVSCSGYRNPSHCRHRLPRRRCLSPSAHRVGLKKKVKTGVVV
jgi:hypothetical protein